MLRAAATALLLCLTGCNTTLRDALARAEAAHGRGDHFGEALALRDACRAAPDEKEICGTARDAADEVIARQLETAKGPCATEPTACLATLEVLAPFAGPSDTRLQPYFDQAGDQVAQSCASTALASPEDAVFQVRCAEAYAKRIATPRYAAHVGQARGRSAAFVDQAATASAAQPGVAWLHASLAACLGGSAQYGAQAQRHRAAFEVAHGLALTVSGRSPLSAAQLCTELQRATGTLVRCDGHGAPLAMEVTAWLDAMRDSPIHEVRTVEVLDHTERWENPDYSSALAERRRARANHEDMVARLSRSRADCQSARTDLARAKYCYNCRARSYEETVCNRQYADEDLERRAQRTLNAAEGTVSNTPAYLTRDVYRTVSYRNVQHRFRVPWYVNVVVAGTPYERSGALSFESTEREGVSAANIAYLPYSEPSEQQRRSELASLTLAQAQAALETELDRLAQARTAVCPAPDVWSDCQVEAALLRRADPVAQFIEDIGHKLDARTDQPWPRAPCLP